MSRCRFTRQAEGDLVEICEFVAQHNPQAAAAMLELFEAKCQTLTRHPEMGRLRGELAPLLRSVLVGRYVIFYRPVPGEIQIIRILHGSRDIESEFKQR